MKRTIICILFLMLFLAPNMCFGGDRAWYYGEVTQIITKENDGSFIVFMDNQEIKDKCMYNRVSFLVSDMGAERTKLAFSMALMAKATGQQWGVVLNVLPPYPDPENPGPFPEEDREVCYAAALSTQGAGIK